MAISHLIAHRIQRPSPTATTTLQLRDNEIALDGKIDECARELKLTFIKKLSKVHGRFSSDTASHPLSNWIAECIDEKMGFVSLTHKAMQHFKVELDKTEVPLDAFVFFVQESFEHTDEMHMYVVDHCHGQYLDGELNISDSLHLDTSGVKLAAKINLREWQGEDKHLNYLSLLIWRGEKDLSDAFVNFMGFTDKADTKVETETFLDAVESYTRNMPEDAAIETREKVVNYCLDQDKSGKRVVISELSHQVNEEESDHFEKFVFEAKPEIKPELIPDRAQLRQYIRISGRNELLSMSFDSKCLGEAIVYDPENDSLTINKIPNALKSRLLKHLKSG